MLVCKPCNYELLRVGVTASIVKTKDVLGLLKAVCFVFNVTENNLKRSVRDRELADARKAFFYLGMLFLDVPQIRLTELLNRDHSTGINAVRVCKELIKTDKAFAKLVNETKQFYLRSNPQILN